MALTPNLAWLLLLIAGLLEIVWALSMKASHGFTRHHYTALTLVAAGLDLVQRRLRDIHVATLDQLRQLTEEEGQQQGADVGAVHVGVRHDHHLLVAQLPVAVVGADPAAEREGEVWETAVEEAEQRDRGEDVPDRHRQRADRRDADEVEFRSYRIVDGAIAEEPVTVVPAYAPTGEASRA